MKQLNILKFLTKDQKDPETLMIIDDFQTKVPGVAV